MHDAARRYAILLFSNEKVGIYNKTVTRSYRWR